MSGFNLSALAVRERAVTLFLIIAITLAGIYAFVQLGRAEDPSFTMKVLTVSAAWPGATAQQMQRRDFSWPIIRNCPIRRLPRWWSSRPMRRHAIV